MCLELREYRIVVAQCLAELLVRFYRLEKSLVCSLIEYLRELLEEVWLDVLGGVKLFAVDIAQRLEEDFFIEVKARRYRLGSVVIEMVDYQPKSAPSCGAWAKKLFRRFLKDFLSEFSDGSGKSVFVVCCFSCFSWIFCSSSCAFFCAL